MLCKLCRNDKKLIEAHIIPQAFSKDVQKAFGKTQILLIEEGKRSRKAPQLGYFDKEILCGTCDGDIGKWEEDLIDLFRKGYENHPYNYSSIKLAILSILWKSHITTNPAFEGVKLGSFWENKLHDLIKNGCASSPEDFSIWINRYKSIDKSGKTNPLTEMIPTGTKGRNRGYGINFYCFGFGGHKIHIVVDKRRFPNNIKTISTLKLITFRIYFMILTIMIPTAI
jgi:hypothetical protein